MAAYEIDQSRWAFILAPQLTGRAQKAYMALAIDNASDYPTIKQAILKRYDINEETHRRKFRERSREKGESYFELATSLMDLANRWLEDCTSKADVLEKITIEHFLAKAPEDVRVWVREHKPSTCAEAGSWADEFQLARNDASSPATGTSRPAPRRCHKCNQVGHIPTSCPSNAKPSGVSPPGPIQTSRVGQRMPSRRPPQQYSSTTRTVQCFSCGQTGHIAAHCRANTMFCDNAEDVLGVEVGEGVVRQGWVEGVPVEVLLDTGSARTLVRKELVPEERVLKGRTVGVRCAHGEVVHYPIAELEVVVGDQKITVKAGISDRLPVQLLLGRDVSEFFSLLATSKVYSDSLVSSSEFDCSSQDQEIVAVTTRAQARKLRSEPVGSTTPKGDNGLPKESTESDDIFRAFADDIFEGGQERPLLTRAQKRADRRRFAAKEASGEAVTKWSVLDMPKEELKEAQRDDPTLAAARKVADGTTDLSAGEGFSWKGGLLYRRWEPKRSGQDSGSVVQLVLPARCRDATLAIAHEIPLGGHLGKTRSGCTTGRPAAVSSAEEIECWCCCTSTHKLRAQWQGPFPIVEKRGEVNYVVDMGRRRLRTFHVNMLREWHERKPLSLFTAEATDVEADDVIPWKEVDESLPLINPTLLSTDTEAINQIVSDFSDVFSSKPGRTDLAEHRIETGRARPILQAPYRLAHAYRATVKQELDEMEQDGIIEPSTSEWASPIVLVPKKDGTMRMCVDYRKFNSVLEADAYPMARIDDLIDRLGGAKYISTLDLTRGYWQVPVAPDARSHTAFTTPFGLYQFKVMPFGLHGAPATFQRMMDILLKRIQDYAGAYLDDLVVFSASWEEHL